jgi:hypothetical protein
MPGFQDSRRHDDISATVPNVGFSSGRKGLGMRVNQPTFDLQKPGALSDLLQTLTADAGLAPGLS